MKVILNFPLLCLNTLLISVLAPPSPAPGDPGGGSGLSFALGNRGYWADSGPDPGGVFDKQIVVVLGVAGFCLGPFPRGLQGEGPDDHAEIGRLRLAARIRGVLYL